VGKMGVDTSIVMLASQTPPAKMYVLTGEELLRVFAESSGRILGSEGPRKLCIS